MGQLALDFIEPLIEHPVMRFETGVELVDLLLNRVSSVSDAFDVADGTGTLHLRHWQGPARAQGALLHGDLGSAPLDPYVEALSKRYDIWTLDLPALGWSSDQERPYDVELAIRRIENVLGEDAKLERFISLPFRGVVLRRSSRPPP